jgi:hypothetical protein
MSGISLVMPAAPGPGATEKEIADWGAMVGNAWADAELVMDDISDRAHLRPIWYHKLPGWQTHGRQFIRLGICTQAQFEAALTSAWVSPLV